MMQQLRRRQRQRRWWRRRRQLWIVICCCIVGSSQIHSSEATVTTAAFTDLYRPRATKTANHQEAPWKEIFYQRRYSNGIFQSIPQRLFIRPHPQRYLDEYSNNRELGNELIPMLEQRRYTERPTLTSPELIRIAAVPAKPKIVVFGASGLIGRTVVRQLLDHPQLNDATIVAFVRDYDKACRVLYDDMIVAASSLSSSSSRRQRGAKLLIVQGDLVPPEELPSFRMRNDLIEVDNEENIKDPSTVSFYEDEILQAVIRDSTAIISCVGTCRITNLWTDYIIRPIYRILCPNVSDWCDDKHHPYYVHYRTIQKIIHYAEQEQLRRQAAAAAAATEDSGRSNIHIVDKSKHQNEQRTNINKNSIPRIRLVRLSDLCVSQPPWYFIPIFVNIFHSMIFRYHYMADQLLQRCTHLDTITIRPGDIVDEERDTTTTSLQVSPSGTVPYPARISRDDTAEVIVAAALWNNKSNARSHDKSKLRSMNADNVNRDIIDTDDKSFHYTLACRWVGGNDLDPYPIQGHISDGEPTAYDCLQKSISGGDGCKGNDIYTVHKSRKQKHYDPSHHQPQQPLSRNTVQPSTTTKIKPYGICTAIPVYLFLSLALSSLVHGIVVGGLGLLQYWKVPPVVWIVWKPIVLSLKHMISTLATFTLGVFHYCLQWIVNNRSAGSIVKYISF